MKYRLQVAFIYACVVAQVWMAHDTLGWWLMVAFLAQWAALLTWWNVPPFWQIRRVVVERRRRCGGAR